VFGGADVLADFENVFSLVADLTLVNPTVETNEGFNPNKK